MLVLMAVFSESSSGGDTEENILACDTVASTGDKCDIRHRIIKEDNKKESGGKGPSDDNSHPAKRTMSKENFEEIELSEQTCKDKEQKVCDIFKAKSDHFEVRVKIGEVEEHAVKAVREASNVVAGDSLSFKLWIQYDARAGSSYC